MKINKSSKKLVMHPRNILREPPNYKNLAIKYKDFRHVCNLELNGKVTLNFRHENTLRELSKVLLLEYFNLKVEFAPGSLIPTLPLRLNYLLWIEDMLAPHQLTTIRGIDIGCGSACIYSILAAKTNGWQMLSLESNDSNIQYARENIIRNNLQDLIEVYAQPDKTGIFSSYFETTNADKNFEFCLCNPPFFDSNKSNPFDGNSRKTQRRPPPKTIRTGTADELTCNGGEVQFVSRIIDESKQYKDRVKIFTSMIGVKANVKEILNHLSSCDISNVTTTEFHQGNTTRWGVAWSYLKDPIDIATK